MAIQRGKKFEKLFEKATLSIGEEYDVDIQRLFDVVGKKTIEQPADYICYKYPCEIYVECKSTHSTSFSFFTQPQYERLIKKSKKFGVKAGMLVWFVTKKRVFWLDIEWMQLYHSSGIKSVSIPKIEERINNKEKGIFEINQVTKRVNPKMNLISFYDYVSGGNNGERSDNS